MNTAIIHLYLIVCSWLSLGSRLCARVLAIHVVACSCGCGVHISKSLLASLCARCVRCWWFACLNAQLIRGFCAVHASKLAHSCLRCSCGLLNLYLWFAMCRYKFVARVLVGDVFVVLEIVVLMPSVRIRVVIGSCVHSVVVR